MISGFEIKHRVCKSKHHLDPMVGIPPSCKGECGRNKPSSFGICYCNPSCLYYGDCCPDYMQHCHITISQNQDKLLPLMTCINVSVSTGIFMFKAIGRCPRKQPMDGDKNKKCEDINRSDIFTQIPVTDIKTGVMYKNKFCTECHGIKNISAISPKFECENASHAVAILQKHGVKTLWSHMQHACKMIFPMTADQRLCHPTIIQACTNTSENSYLCHSYAELAHINYRMIFKNYHCAICNGLDQSEIQKLECYKSPFDSLIGIPEVNPFFR